MKISEDIRYIGVNDRDIDLFEGMYEVPNGMAYNSYVITDEKTAVMDTVDATMGTEWLQKLDKALGDRKPDYLIISHMEPDHSSNIVSFKEKYPEAVIVGTKQAFAIMKNFFGTDYADSRIIVNDGDTLELGSHTLTFVTAPMVHWPEVMMTYDNKDKVMFTADAFGKFGTLDTDEDWACEARRYYFGIVGKFGTQVQAALKKINALDVQTICPLHGPILNENLDHYLGLYNTWSSYGTESEGIVINYTSVYGNTKQAVELLAQKLEDMGCPKVAVNDLARCDMAEAVEDTFRYGKVVFATTTYNGGMFPFMQTFIESLVERNFKNKLIGFIDNGSWNPMAAKAMKGMFEKAKDLTLCENEVKILSAVSDENVKQIEALAKELMEK